MRLAAVLLLFSIAVAPRVSAQTWDTSGNSQLNGTYYFRDVIWVVDNQSDALDDGLSIYGNITFDGNGHYTLANYAYYDGAGSSYTIITTGTYSISASGYGSISHPLSPGDSIFGLVSNGIFIGSATENVSGANSAGFNDLFIAAPLASPTPTNSFFKGAYTMMQLDSPTGSVLYTSESRLQLTADGSGNIGNVNATGYISGNGSTVTNQNFSGVKYYFSNGAAVVNLGQTLNPGSNLLAGQKYLYFSPDGNFVFGGSPQGWDMIIGVRSGTTSPNFGGLYYQAGLDQDNTQLANNFADVQSYYGSFKATDGVILGHERFLSVFQSNAIDYTYSGSYSLNSNGTYDDGTYSYVFGNGGALRIGIGDPPTIGINVAIQGPTFTPSGVFINPTGVVNAASSSMFTAGVAPGEFISIYGSNLASTTQADGSFPFNLGGVQVMVNGRQAPIYVVSPTQISAVIPFETSEVIASIQVVNNNVPSNTVSSFVNLTAPGVFTNPAGGLGSAAALHADYSLVSASSPAQIGETIAVYLTGLGAVTPTVSDGTPGPSSPPYSMATNTINVYVDNVQATTTFVGLAPALIGLYQINFAVPSGVSNGYVNLDISGPDAYTSESVLPVGVVSGSARKAAGQPKVERSNFGKPKIKTRL
jgi:uncharacterized protein (TIGR03437 family)